MGKDSAVKVLGFSLISQRMRSGHKVTRQSRWWLSQHWDPRLRSGILEEVLEAPKSVDS